MKYKIANFKRELEEDNFNVFVHGCNLQGLFSAGIAGIVRSLYPKCYDLYSDAIESYEYEGGQILPYEISDHKLVLNAFTQIHPGRNGSYDLIDKAFSTIGRVYSDSKICFPLIGCGIAGLEWSVVEKIIDHNLKGLDYTCIVRIGDVIKYNLPTTDSFSITMEYALANSHKLLEKPSNRKGKVHKNGTDGR